MRITQEMLRARVCYDADTGYLFWIKSGKLALHSIQSAGYRHGWIFGVDQLAHRMIYLLHHGKLPKLVDHIDRDRLNNRIENLRAADYHLNSANSAKVLEGSCPHVAGVFRNHGKWRARIMVDGKIHELGNFESMADAIKARKEAEKSLLPLSR